MSDDKNSRVVWNSDQGWIGGGPAGKSSKKGKKRAGPAQDAGFPHDGVTRLRRETSGRGGKTVTVVFGAPGSSEDRIRLLKELKQRCGCGGALKDGRIEIQGDHRDQIMAMLVEKGIEVKVSGG